MAEAHHHLDYEINPLVVRSDPIQMHRVVNGGIPRHHRAHLQRGTDDTLFDNSNVLTIALKLELDISSGHALTVMAVRSGSGKTPDDEG